MKKTSLYPVDRIPFTKSRPLTQLLKFRRRDGNGLNPSMAPGLGPKNLQSRIVKMSIEVAEGPARNTPLMTMIATRVILMEVTVPVSTKSEPSF